MNTILIFIIGLVVGGLVVYLWGEFGKGKAGAAFAKKGFGEPRVEHTKGLIEKQADEKRRGKEAIMGLLEAGNGPLTNNMVEQMLGISDATAERYLQELENEGKVKQVGKTGHAVYYEKI